MLYKLNKVQEEYFLSSLSNGDMSLLMVPLLLMCNWPHTITKELVIYPQQVSCRWNSNYIHCLNSIWCRQRVLTGNYNWNKRTKKNIITNSTLTQTYSGTNISKYINHSNLAESRSMEILMIRYSSLCAVLFAPCTMSEG